MRITLPTGTVAEIARPAGSPRLGLVVTPDIFGVRPHFDDLAAGWARDWGMAVAVVDQYAGNQPADDADVNARFAAVAAIDDDRHLADLHAAADALATPVVGLMGFCMGGMYCFNSGRSDRFARIVSFYGMITLPDAWKGPGHGEPLDHLRAGHADRVLAIIGGKDTWTPADQVERLREVGVSVVEYPDAEHAFAHDPSRPIHRADDAADAFARARAWLENA
jgi:carboxymethylenebutenolidase